MPDPEGRPATTTIAISDLAALCEASEVTIRDLIRRGVLPKASGGRLPLIEAVRAMIQHVRFEARDASLTAAQESARAARAEASELALAVERRDLIADEDAQAAADHVAGAIVTAIGGMAARVTRDMGIGDGSKRHCWPHRSPSPTIWPSRRGWARAGNDRPRAR